MHRAVPYVQELAEPEKAQLEALVQVFLAKISFEGCGGLEVTDEMRISIATQACILVLGKEGPPYPDLATVLVYPSAFLGRRTESMGGGVVVTTDEARLGESWDRGLVVLAWDSAERGANNPRDGKNVVFHEFAHQLDGESGDMDGAPRLGSRAHYAQWARVFGAEYTALLNRLSEGRRSDIDAYGATSPPEFFAVLTEIFFEAPERLLRRHPELYAELAAFYRQDPAARRRAQPPTKARKARRP
jgi:Mlc titration factor MtfA (ptsG expression regulator)